MQAMQGLENLRVYAVLKYIFALNFVLGETFSR